MRLEQIVNPHQITDKRPESFLARSRTSSLTPHINRMFVDRKDFSLPPNPSQSRYAQDCGRILVQIFRKACVLFVRWRSDKLKN